jgi:hypothetical protein
MAVQKSPRPHVVGNRTMGSCCCEQGAYPWEGTRPRPPCVQDTYCAGTVEEETTVLGPNDKRIRDKENGGWV